MGEAQASPGHRRGGRKRPGNARVQGSGKRPGQKKGKTGEKRAFKGAGRRKKAVPLLKKREKGGGGEGKGRPENQASARKTH